MGINLAMSERKECVSDADETMRADRAARVWRAPIRGLIQIGSEAHKTLFCRMLLETFNPYKPAVIEWPKLTEEERLRLVSLPIWDVAVRTEGNARLRVVSYAQSLTDPLLKQAVELDAFEEGRHKEVLAKMVAAYGIQLAEEQPYPKPRDPEWAFMATGFSECIDSFFAFGLFERAKRSGYFAPALVDTFEPVMQEECRLILFFVNWLAWHRCNLPWWRRPLFLAKIVCVAAFIVWERLRFARSFDNAGHERDTNFTLTGNKVIAGEFDTAELIDVCLAENERRMSGYDERLLRPTLVPRLARMARRFMPRRSVKAQRSSETGASDARPTA
jgi:hypothetical protein